MPDQDYAAEVLKPLSFNDQVKDKAWNAYYNATDAASFKSGMDAIPELDNATKNNLWSRWRQQAMGSQQVAGAAQMPAQPSTSAVTQSPAEIPPAVSASGEKDGLLGQFAKSGARAFVNQLYGGTGGLVTMAGDLLGSEALRAGGAELTGTAQRFGSRMSENMPVAPRTSEVGMSAMANPNWWAQVTGDGLGSLIASAAAGGLTDTLVKQLVARGVVKGGLAMSIANNSAPLAGGAYEGLMQMGSTYNEAKAKGLDERAALEAAIYDGAATGALGVLGEKWGIFNKESQSLVTRMGRSALAEGVTEGVLQQPVSNFIASGSYDPGRPIFQDSPEAFVGGAAGGPFGGVIGAMVNRPQQTAPPPGAPPQPGATAGPQATAPPPGTPPPPPAPVPQQLPLSVPASPVPSPVAPPAAIAPIPPVTAPTPAPAPAPPVATPQPSTTTFPVAPSTPIATPEASPQNDNSGVQWLRQLGMNVSLPASQAETPAAPAVLETPQAPAVKASERGKLGEADAIFGSSDEGITPNQTPVKFRYAVADARSVRTSFDEGYDQSLQPRDTKRVGSRQRVEARKGDMRPEAMGYAFLTTDGAPVVNSAGDLITRNHGTRALQELYAEGRPRAQEYKNWLTQKAGDFGLSAEDIQGIEQPILVRVTEGGDPNLQVEVARESNLSSTATMSDAEQAIDLAKNTLKGSVWNDYRPTEDGIPNAEFAMAVLSKLPPEAQNAFVDKQSRLSITGVRRLREAVFAKAYGDTSILNAALETLDNNVKNITNGMMLAAPEMALLDEDSGKLIADGYGLGQDLSIAASAISNIRKRGLSVQDWLNQQSTTREPIDIELVKMLDKYKRSGRKVGEVLKSYSRIVRSLQNPSMGQLFEAQPLPSKEEVLLAAQESVGEVTAADESTTNAETAGQQQGLIEDEPGQQAAAEPAQDGEAAESMAGQTAPASDQLPGSDGESRAGVGEQQANAPAQQPVAPRSGTPQTAPPPGAPQSAPKKLSLNAPLIKTTQPPPGVKKPEPKAATPESKKEAKPEKPISEMSDEEKIFKLQRDADEDAKAARERIRARLKGNTLSSGIDPELLADYAIIGKSYIIRGAISLKNFSAKMVAEFGEDIQPHLEAIWERAVALAEEAQKKLFGEDTDVQRGNEPETSGGKNRTVDSGEQPKVSAEATRSTATSSDGQGGASGDRRRVDADSGSQPAQNGSPAAVDERPTDEPPKPKVEAEPVKGPGRKIVTIMEDSIPQVDQSEVPEKYRDNPDPSKRMQPHQVLSTALAMKALNNPMIGGFLLADGPGAGKTLTALAIADMARQKGRKVLVVSKAEVFKFPTGKKYKDDRPKGTYDEWANKWDIPIYRYLGAGDPLVPGQIQLATYDNFRYALKAIDDNTTVIFDEGHALKNVSRDSARSVIGLKMMERAGQVLYMSATPADRIEDIQYLASMGVFGSRDTEKVLKSLGLIRKSAQVKKFDIETGQFIKKGKKFEREPGFIYSSPAGKRKAVVKAMTEAFQAAVKNGTMIKREIPLDNYDIDFKNISLQPEDMAILSEIEEVYNQYGWSSGLRSQARDFALRAVLEELYSPHAIDLALTALEKGKKVIFFTTRVNDREIGPTVPVYGPDGEEIDRRRIVVRKSPGTPKLLRGMLRENGIFGNQVVELTSTGEDDEGNKLNVDEVMRAFNEGDARVLITTPESGGTGLNLDDRVGDKPREIINLTPPFGATDLIQMFGRIDRLSTKSRAQANVFFSDHRVSAWNVGIIAGKLQTLGAIVRGVPASLVGSVPVTSDFIDETGFDTESEDGNNDETAKPKSKKRGRRDAVEFPAWVRWDSPATGQTEAEISRWRVDLPGPQLYFEKDARTTGRYGYLQWALGNAKQTSIGDWTYLKSVGYSKVVDVEREIERLTEQIPEDDIIEAHLSANESRIIYRAPYGIMSFDFKRRDNRGTGSNLGGTLAVNCYRNSMYPNPEPPGIRR